MSLKSSNALSSETDELIRRAEATLEQSRLDLENFKRLEKAFLERKRAFDACPRPAGMTPSKSQNQEGTLK